MNNVNNIATTLLLYFKLKKASSNIELQDSDVVYWRFGSA